MKIRSLFACVLALCAALFCSCGDEKKSTGSSSIKKDEKVEFSVLNFTPDGELPSSVHYPSIQIQFSEPVAALEKLGEASDKSDLVKIEPALEGVYRWYGTSLLSFEASDSVIPLKEYTVTVSPDVTSIYGNKITGCLQFKFHCEELKIVNVRPASELAFVDKEEVPLEEGRDIIVTFNYKINPDVIHSYLQVRSGNNVLQYKTSYKKENENVLHLHLNEKLPFDKTIEVVLPEGSMADNDCFATTSDDVQSFHSLTPFALKEFSDRDIWGYSGKNAVNPVEFRFNHQIKQGTEQQIASKIQTEPAMKVSKENIIINGNRILLHTLPVTFGSKYKVKISKTLEDAYGLTLADDIEKEVEVPQAASYVHFKDYGTKILEAQFAPKLAFKYQNIIRDSSSYSIKSIADAKGGGSLTQKKEDVHFSDRQVPENTACIEAVDLSKVLEKTSEGYRGSVLFDSSISYTEGYRDWKTKKMEYHTEKTDHKQQICVTDLAMTIRYCYNEAVVMVTKLSTGEAVKDAVVTAFMNSDGFELNPVNPMTVIGSSVTDENGIAVISASGFSKKDDVYFEAKTSNDRVVTPGNGVDMWRTATVSTGYPSSAVEDREKIFVFTDRGLYKPGEKMTFRGIKRILKGGKYRTEGGSLHIKITDGVWDPKVLTEFDVKLSENGTFWGEWKIPESTEPGTYSIGYTGSRANYLNSLCNFQVQFFERLRFEAKSEIADVTYYRGDKLNAQVTANYLGGGSLSGCQTETWWSREPCGFVPADRNRFEGMRFGPVQGYDGRSTLGTSKDVINGDGKTNVSQATGDEKLKGMAYRYRVETSVADNGGQSISAVASAIVHPAKYYIGLGQLKNVNGFPKKGDVVKLDYTCIRPDGSLASAADSGTSKTMKLELLREEWKEVQQVGWDGQVNTRYEKEMKLESEKNIAMNYGAARTEISVSIPKGGSYILRASARDSKGNDVVTEKRFYAIGSDWSWWNSENSEEITMSTDKSLYAVGDTARILVQTPLEKGRYMMTVEREGIVSHKLLNIKERTSTIDVPVTEDFIPVMYVTLSSYSVRSGKPVHDFDSVDLDKPKGYFGLAAIHVDPSAKSFNVQIESDKPSYRPAEKATLKLHASKDGKPVANAELTVMVVDRGVIDLIGYHVPDPMKYFYDEHFFPDCVKGSDTRNYLMDPVTYEIRNQFGGDSLSDDAKMQERKNFDPTALFVPDLFTDENGDVSVDFKLPDSLTAYRVTVIGVKENTYALSESEVKAANPVSVRDVLPRQLRLNDEGELGVVISNLDAVPHKVTVTAKLYDGLEKSGVTVQEGEVEKLPGHAQISGTSEKEIVVPADKTESLMFMMSAKKEGWFTVEYTVKSDIVNEKIYKPLQIEKPYIYENVTTVGQVRNVEGEDTASAEELVKIPSDIENGKGSLYVQLDPTKLGVLKESVDYCFHYPYGCMEQKSSAMLPLVAFGDYVKPLGLDSEVKNYKAFINHEMKKWAKVQHKDGGFSYWPDGTYSDDFVTCRIGEIAAIAIEKGLVKNDVINISSLKTYIAGVARETNDYCSSVYRRSYACYVLSRLGGSVSDGEIMALADSKNADVESKALCALALLNKGSTGKAKSIGSKLIRQTKMTARGIEIIPFKEDAWYSWFNDESERYALYLQLFSQLDKANIMNEHLVYQLLQIEKAYNGYWKSTAVTSRVLAAFDVYIRANDLTGTDFTAEALLGENKVLEGKFKGLGAEAVEKNLLFTEDPLKTIARDAEIPFKFTKKGEGVLYYTLSMKYALPADQQKARDEGICMYTEITDVQTGQVVEGNRLEAGKIYREKVYITTTRNRNFVAVRAPVPAGCEIMNAAFTTTGTLPQSNEASSEDYDEDYYYLNDVYDLSNQNIYDSEVQYFWNKMCRGSQSVEFLFRAVRKGTYNVPSGVAECMYDPEIFGRTSGKVWKIE